MSVLVKGLTKQFGKQKAVNNISFEVKKGTILGFLGPNGAGKTTTMKMITCFLPPSKGQVSVCGFDVYTQAMEVRRKIGYLPEHNPLYKDMYVKEYLNFVAGLYGIKNKKQRVEDMIEQTGLEREKHKIIGTLSKGYRQRVGLAQAMMHDPEVLILDEPTSGLDPNQLIEIRHLIKQLGKEKTVLFSTHIMQEVQAICNQVLIIHKGQIVANDSIDSLQQKVAGETILTIETLQNVSTELLKKIPHVEEVVSLGNNRWQLKTLYTKEDWRHFVFDFAVQNQLTLLEMKKETYSVEDVFQKLTQ